MSQKKAQIEIKAGYIATGKQFVGFSLRQKRISSTATIVAEDDPYYLQNLYTNLFFQVLVTLAENASKFCPHN